MEYFNLHTHIYTNQPNILELVNQYPYEFDGSIPFYSTGIHPWYIDEKRLESDLQIIESKLKEPNCLAVGECGLDKRIEKKTQLKVHVADDPLKAVVRGTGEILKNLEKYKPVLIT